MCTGIVREVCTRAGGGGGVQIEKKASSSYENGSAKLPYRVTALKGLLKSRSSDAFPRIETNTCLDTSYH
jgi:hypothetical protein